ncbi:MAG: hypothetical protein RLZ98_3458 [Pseudomonadota bacterium]|jgi:hypothetical protein
MQLPHDIMKSAENALDALLCNCAESCGGTTGVREASIMDIARALAAEREACAKVVEDHAQHHMKNGRATDASIVGVVADAIRNRSN